MRGRLLLVWRLARGDIRRRRAQSALLVVMIATTITTLTLGLVLHGVTNSPFARTRAATKGPDAMALFEPGFHGSEGTFQQFVALRQAPGVTASTGPYPVAELELAARGATIRVKAEGRDHDRAALDQPLVTAGNWTAPGGVVLERGFADALGVHVGDTVLLNKQRFTVRGVALTSAMPTSDPLVWVTRGDLVALTGQSQPSWYTLNLKLADPAGATAFANAHNGPNTAWLLESWQQLR
ncbi:MAG TPA: ABC transporter permease, partial [Thermomicrobiaceae bacterium]|nr:ABC transporter permease [Thermomicrobiaceae bacterium]